MTREGATPTGDRAVLEPHNETLVEESGQAAIHPAVVELAGVHKVFATKRAQRREGFVAVSDVNLSIREGEFVSLVGPSGCGKTTVLNMIAGLILPTEGLVTQRGKPIYGLNVGIGYVTQDETLLPWRTLLGNVTYGLELAGVGRKEADERARDYIARVNLEGFEHHYPHQLSGGMRKRATLIRTLVLDPDIILMDEPFGALDAQTRLLLQHDLLELWRGTRKTIIFVTHDLVESITLSDRVVTFRRNPGGIRSVHTVGLARPRDVFHIHQSPGYDRIYEEIWSDIRGEMTLNPQTV